MLFGRWGEHAQRCWVPFPPFKKPWLALPTEEQMSNLDRSSTAYFEAFEPAIRADDDAADALKPHDAGGDVLPFEHLDGRRFEILAYRLKCASGAKHRHRVALMQGTGERGRDVVVHDASGRLIEIVQCKNLDDRLTEPIAKSEILKLALHAYLQPVVLGTGPVKYELWCPRGLSEPATLLLDSWPSLWTAGAVESVAERLFDKYAAFHDLKWEKVRHFVLEEFPKLLSPHRSEGVDISAMVRDTLPIYESFFDGRVVMNRDDTISAVREAAEAGTAASLERFGDKDAIHILDRINSFPSNKRIVGTNGYVMGLPIELVSRFRRAEYEEYAKCSIQATFGLTVVVQNACSRIARELVDELRGTIMPKNPAYFTVVLKTLTFSMLAKLNGLPMPSMRHHQPGLEKYSGLSLDERIEHHAGQVWGECSASLTAYDSATHGPGSDEAIRARIAMHELGNGTSQADFEMSLRADVQRFHHEIEAVFGRFMSLIPTDLLVITDALTVLEKGMLFNRMFETTRELTKLRGSEVIPE